MYSFVAVVIVAAVVIVVIVVGVVIVVLDGDAYRIAAPPVADLGAGVPALRTGTQTLGL